MKFIVVNVVSPIMMAEFRISLDGRRRIPSLLLLSAAIFVHSSAADFRSSSNSSDDGYRRSPDRPIKLAVILPFQNDYMWSKQKVGPAIDYAVESLKTSLPAIGDSLVVNYGDSKCSETLGPLIGIEMFYNKSADVFIGPACDYAVAPIARFSPHWNIPVITGKALPHAFSDKNLYGLLTRISGSYDKLGESVASLYRQFNWSIPGFIFNSNLGERQRLGKSDCYFIMEGVNKELKPIYQQLHPDREIWFRWFDEGDKTEPNWHSILGEASQKTRSKSQERQQRKQRSS